MLLAILDHCGKPSAQKISSNTECRNWDPTDPSPNNPWKSYSKPSSTGGSKEKVNNTTTENTVENTVDSPISNTENTIDENTVDNTLSNEQSNNEVTNSDNENVEDP